MNRPSSEEDPEIEILEAVLEALDRQAEVQQVHRRFPGLGEAVERLWGESKRYLEVEKEMGASLLPESPRSGDALGEFELVELHGTGGMGRVWRARQRSLGGRIVALKTVHRERVPPLDQERFEREALAAAALHHPNLAEIYGFGRDARFLFYAMRFVEGPSLHEVLVHTSTDGQASRDPETIREIVRLGADVADALAFVHGHGLVHGDVKPSNIVLDGPGKGLGDLRARHAVLVDFGLVRPSAQGGESPGGTFAYMAPRQEGGRSGIPADDVFALGATLHDLLSGRLPGQRPSAAIGLEPLELLAPHLDADLLALVGKAVEFQAKRRYADGAEMGRDLRAWLRGDSVTARHPGTAERVRRWVRKHPDRVLRALRKAIGILVLLAMIAWIGMVAVGQHRLAVAAEKAYGSYNLAGLCWNLQAIEPLAGRLFLSDKLRPIARRLRSLGEDDRLFRVAEKGRLEGQSALLHLAACYLQRDGLLVPENDLLARFLMHALKRPEEGAPERQEMFSTAAFLIARLFYESPDCSPEVHQRSAPFRSRIRDLIDWPALRPSERLYLLAALGGCGSPEDLDRLLRLIEAEHERGTPFSELARLSWMTMDRILRRISSCGLQDEYRAAVPEALLRRAQSLFMMAADEHFAGELGWTPWYSVLTTWVLLGRREGLQLAVDPRLLQMVRDERPPTSSQIRLLAAFGTEEEETILRLVENGEWGDDAEVLGWVCAFLYEEDGRRSDGTVFQGRARFLDYLYGEGTVPTTEELRAFERGIRKGLGVLDDGWNPDLEPDKDSRLGSYLPEDPSLAAGDPSPFGEGNLPEGPTAIPPPWRCVPASADGESVLAAWSLRRTPLPPGLEVTLAGAASPPTTDGPVTLQLEGQAHVRFHRPNDSAVHFPFELSPEKARNLLTITLIDQKQAREYMPYRGVALVEILIDGFLLVRDRAATHYGFCDQDGMEAVRGNRTLLTEGFLPAGEHTLSVRLRNSTTTYSLRRVTIETQP